MTCHNVNKWIPVFFWLSWCYYWPNPPVCPLLYLTSQTCLFTYTLTLPHSRMIISVKFYVMCVCILPLLSWMGCLHRRRRRRAGRNLGGVKGSPGRAAAACVLLSAAGSAVVLQGDFGSPCPLRSTENASQFLLWQTPSTHRHFPCSFLSLGSQLGLSPEATKLGWLDDSKVVTFVC